MQCIIEKENNFKQPGDRYRSFAPDRSCTPSKMLNLLSFIESRIAGWFGLILFFLFFFLSLNFCRQERFIRRIVEGLSDPRLTHELRTIWISYWSQVTPISNTVSLRRSSFPLPIWAPLMIISWLHWSLPLDAVWQIAGPKDRISPQRETEHVMTCGWYA